MKYLLIKRQRHNFHNVKLLHCFMSVVSAFITIQNSSEPSLAKLQMESEENRLIMEKEVIH